MKLQKQTQEIIEMSNCISYSANQLEENTAESSDRQISISDWVYGKVLHKEITRMAKEAIRSTLHSDSPISDADDAFYYALRDAGINISIEDQREIINTAGCNMHRQ
jgi:hypothetical protein